MLRLLRVGEGDVVQLDLALERVLRSERHVGRVVLLAVVTVQTAALHWLEGVRRQLEHSLRRSQRLRDRKPPDSTSMMREYTFIVAVMPDETLIVYMAKEASWPPVSSPPAIMFPPTHNPHKTASFLSMSEKGYFHRETDACAESGANSGTLIVVVKKHLVFRLIVEILASFLGETPAGLPPG